MAAVLLTSLWSTYCQHCVIWRGREYRRQKSLILTVVEPSTVLSAGYLFIVLGTYAPRPFTNYHLTRNQLYYAIHYINQKACAWESGVEQMVSEQLLQDFNNFADTVEKDTHCLILGTKSDLIMNIENSNEQD